MVKEETKVKLISWNVNGLRAVVGKGFADIFNELDADIFWNMSSTGSMGKGKDIPEQRYLPVLSL